MGGEEGQGRGTGGGETKGRGTGGGERKGQGRRGEGRLSERGVWSVPGMLVEDDVSGGEQEVSEDESVSSPEEVAPRPVFSSLTLRFFKEEMNHHYYVQHVQNTLLGLDRVGLLFQCVFFVFLFTRQQACSSACLAAFYLLVPTLLLWLFLAHTPSPPLRRLYPSLRTPLVLLWKLLMLPTVGSHLLGSHKFQLSMHSTLSMSSSLLLLLTASRTLFLSFQSLAFITPFWLHAALLPLQLSVLIPASSTPPVSLFCECCRPMLLTLHSALQTTATILQPTAALVTATATAPSRTDQPPPCPARQVVLFTLLGVGGLVPSALVYYMEACARLRYVEGHKGGWGLSERAGRRYGAMARSRPLGVLFAGQVGVVLTLGWHLLAVVCD